MNPFHGFLYDGLVESPTGWALAVYMWAVNEAWHRVVESLGAGSFASGFPVRDQR